MKMMLSSFDGHSMIDIGTQAMAGIGRSISEIGKTISRTSLKRPMIRPSGTATTAAMLKPNRMRRQLSITCMKNLVSCDARIRLSNTCPGGGHVDEADVHVDAVFGEQVPGQQEQRRSDKVPTASARSCPRCSRNQRSA